LFGQVEADDVAASKEAAKAERRREIEAKRAAEESARLRAVAEKEDRERAAAQRAKAASARREANTAATKKRREVRISRARPCPVHILLRPSETFSSPSLFGR
jgi:hypothetical protein